MTKVALSIGGNQKESLPVFFEAYKQLEEAGFTDIKSADIYLTPPVGCPPDTPDFYNTALIGEWEKSPEELFYISKKIEQKAGRPPDHPRFDSRILDIDIIFFGERIISTDKLSIPHPQAWERLFVLIPLTDIAPEWIFPGKNITVKQRLEYLKNKHPEEYNAIKKRR